MSVLFDFLRYVGIFEILYFVVINNGLNNVRSWELTAVRDKVLHILESIHSVSAACLLSSRYWKQLWLGHETDYGPSPRT
jgi:uncharacterized membrane protein